MHEWDATGLRRRLDAATDPQAYPLAPPGLGKFRERSSVSCLEISWISWPQISRHQGYQPLRRFVGNCKSVLAHPTTASGRPPTMMSKLLVLGLLNVGVALKPDWWIEWDWNDWD